MRLRRGEHARLQTSRWAVAVASAQQWLQAMETGRGRWSW
jgi:hypothetical protein